MTTILLALAALLFQSPPASVEGRIVRQGTGDPVVRASVLLTKDGGRLQDSVVVVTDDRGAFSIPNLPAGNYRLFGEHADYVKAEYGQRNAGRPGTGIALTSGQKLGGIVIELTPTGAIAGRVVDRNGEPDRARIQALKQTYALGETKLIVVAEGQTNDLGEYRLFGLPPGSYLLSASPFGFQQLQSGMISYLYPPAIDALFSIADGHSELSRLIQAGQFIDPEVLDGPGNLMQYYPGVKEPAEARSVVLAPGAVLTGLDFQPLRVASARRVSVRIRGVVIDGATGQPADNANVQLSTPAERAFAMDSLTRSTDVASGASGSFEIENVDAGHYVLLASNQSGTSDRTVLDIVNSDVDGLRLVLGPRITLNGRVTVEGHTTSLDLTKARVILQAPFPREIAPRADGTFSIANVTPRDYRIALGGTLANFYLKSAHLGDADVLAGVTLNTTPRQPLELVISANTGTLDGVVSEGDRRPAPGVRVVLVPDAARRKYFEMYRAVSTDASGKFHIEGIVPGEYNVFAWEEIEENAWQVPEIIRRFEDQGKFLLMGESGRQTLNLYMIAR